MIFKVKIPSAPLDQFIESIVYFRDYESDYSIEKRLPDGKLTLVIDLTNDPKKVFTDYQSRKYHKIRNGWISGIQKKYLIYDAGKISSSIVIEFKPGMCYPFLKIPLNEFTNRTLELEDIWGNEFLRLRQRLINTTNIDVCFDLLENFLLRKSKNELEINPYVSFFLDSIQKSPQIITLVELIKKIGFSNKHFTDIFKRNVGTTPKHFTRVKKFQHIIKSIETNNDINWAQFAIESGYYDQSHFINEFKNFSGINPSEYTKIRGEFLNYIPID